MQGDDCISSFLECPCVTLMGGDLLHMCMLTKSFIQSSRRTRMDERICQHVNIIFVIHFLNRRLAYMRKSLSVSLFENSQEICASIY
jgi:hypothetical protein